MLQKFIVMQMNTILLQHSPFLNYNLKSFHIEQRSNHTNLKNLPKFNNIANEKIENT